MASTMTERHPFDRRVDDTKVSKSDLNFVIMDYLIKEGYPAAAQKFATEANIQQPSENGCIEERVQIRNDILSGNIKSAISQIIELDPELLDLNSSLHFSLLRLQLIELIRPCTISADADVIPALEFSQTSLAPLAPTDPKFLEDLERTMALLIYPSKTPPPMLAGLLEPELRQEVAAKVNEVILTRQGIRAQAKIMSLVKLRTWAEKKAREQGRELPPSMDIWTDALAIQGSAVEDTLMSHDGDHDEEAMAA